MAVAALPAKDSYPQGTEGVPLGLFMATAVLHPSLAFARFVDGREANAPRRTRQACVP